MTEVEFINQPDTLTKVKDAVESIAARGDLCSKDLPDWELMSQNLSESMSNINNITLANVHKYKILKKKQCLFIMLALPTHFLNENPSFISDMEQDIRNPIYKIIRNSLEFSLLNQSGLEFSEFNASIFNEWEYDIKTSVFIEWLESSELIEPQQRDTALDKYNNYKRWAKNHNTVATVVALNQYDGKLKGTSSILKDKNFYEQLLKKLVPIEHEGTDKPKAKTLQNYVSDYNNPPKK
jgi:hypothetical protein